MISRRWRGVKTERRWAAVFFGVLIRKKKEEEERKEWRESCISQDREWLPVAVSSLCPPLESCSLSCDPRPHILLLPPWAEPSMDL